MRKFIFVVSIASLVLSLGACGSKNDSKNQEATVVTDAAHNSQNSLNWDGVYTGTIPCADCEGIQVQITLNLDETYQMTYHYIAKDEATYDYTGTFKWNDDGSIITLDNSEVPRFYKVGENKLTQLDMEGNEITGGLADNYILTKSVPAN
jgi:uncharacterized lipoprotein NlpE involved in copper resistance